MNVSKSDFSLAPQAWRALERGFDQFSSLLISLLLPSMLLYFTLYAGIVRSKMGFYLLAFSTLLTFWLLPYIYPLPCRLLTSLQYNAIGIATMKILDLVARRHDFPRYRYRPLPKPWLLAMIMFVELRYESFEQNHIRVSRADESFSEPFQLAIHVGIFCVLQAMPQEWNIVMAYEVLLGVYIIWTTLQLFLRYKSSPALFGPLYKASSLTRFWSETWHNAFSSPCESLCYRPLRHGLPNAGVPVPIARSLGVVAAFGLMGVFHVYILMPLVEWDGLVRVGAFFLLNGIGTVFEAIIWGKREHWLKGVAAWTFETIIASWTAEALGIPRGLHRVPWQNMCAESSQFRRQSMLC